ncbi:MAG TPA: IS256 family transposase [Methylomirabilota bacterium]|jgi:transposase-like protein|nr:IS256 family transposase [Methylomirabilota bacterium]
MAEHIRIEARPHDGRPSPLGELIHAAVRRAIEVAVDEELTAALGARPYERGDARGGYRNGTKARTLTGPTGPLALAVPRARLFTPTGRREWVSSLLPRYQRRLREVNEAVVATYLAGANTRRLRGALAPLLRAAPLSKSSVSRIVGTLKAELEAWRTRSLADLDVLGLYLDALALRVRSAGKVVSVPALGVVAVLTDGQKQLVALELCPGGETFPAWKGCLDDLGARGLGAPVWCVIDGHPGLRKAVGLAWPAAVVQRCCVHKLRNLERKAPKHVLADIRADFHRIVYAEHAAAARAAYTAFERKWTPRCPGVVRSLQEGGEELLTFFQFPKRQWKTLRTTNVIERLNEEFRRRVKTQGALPTEDAALVLLVGLVVSGQIRLRRLDGWRQIPAMLRDPRRSAA